MKNAFSLVLLSIVTTLFLPLENMIASDRMLSTMNINGADVMDLSFLKQLEEKRKNTK